MKVETTSFKKIEKMLKKRQLGIIELDYSELNLDRLISIFNNIESAFLTPRQPGMDIKTYANKLIKNAYNFVITDNEKDIGIVSLYANDFTNKLVFINAIGLLSSYQSKNIGNIISEFIIDFSKEKGMEILKSHIDKRNQASLGLATKFKLKIEGELDENTYIMSRDLREDEQYKN
ncbi:GNAT family N-acetyltransferase [Bacillus massilinigeriensis]|uniref:GNAT family N-acetyltransferase n=1 Tax=Bacillus massilionigeriensis TaxID=1805475 RepID=UPI00096B5E5A|nr:GNAT family N-acetyltransferase [Bacillus massilionigeriensis]